MRIDREVVVEREGATATVWLNRPTAYNALSETVLLQLGEAFEQLGREPDVRAVVLAGRGSAFCAGHDLREMRAEPGEQYYRQLFELCTKVMTAIRSLPQPVIARVQGIATAAGCQLVATCDLAVASEDIAITLRRHDRTDTAIEGTTGRARAAIALTYFTEPN